MVELELDKVSKQLQEKDRLLTEQERIINIEKSKLVLKDTELRESCAKLSVYEQIEQNSRLTSLYDDVGPELLKNRNLKQ